MILREGLVWTMAQWFFYQGRNIQEALDIRASAFSPYPQDEVRTKSFTGLHQLGSRGEHSLQQRAVAPCRSTGGMDLWDLWARGPNLVPIEQKTFQSRRYQLSPSRPNPMKPPA